VAAVTTPMAVILAASDRRANRVPTKPITGIVLDHEKAFALPSFDRSLSDSPGDPTKQYRDHTDG
jgi:hypothetical protein